MVLGPLDSTRVLVARVIGAARHGDRCEELVRTAQGRVDVLELALAAEGRPGPSSSPDTAVLERLRAAIDLADGVG
jgi:hypothetical protein